jgi:H/ACA ribonucleoprotein complex subunit 1
MNQVFFTVKPAEGIVAMSFKKGDKVFIGGDKLLPLERFLPKPKGPVVKRPGGRGGRGGGDRGRGRGGFSRGGGRGGFAPRGGSRGGFGASRGGGRGARPASGSFRGRGRGSY